MLNLACFSHLVRTAPTRGHALKLVKPRCHLDIRKFSFAHRVVVMWNSLDDDIIACNSINGFKNRIDKFLNGRGFIKAFYRASFPRTLLYLSLENVI